TSLAFICGCIPLWTATGAGAVARQIMGTTVIGGMLAGSAVGIFFVPAVFYVVERFSAHTLPGTSPVNAAQMPSQSSGAADDYEENISCALSVRGPDLWLRGRT